MDMIIFALLLHGRKTRLAAHPSLESIRFQVVLVMLFQKEQGYSDYIVKDSTLWIEK